MTYSHCPNCGHRYPIAQSMESILPCLNCGETFYRNSKPTASVLIVRDGKLLLGKRRHNPSKGMWDVIGGFLNYGEHPLEGAKREAREETGLNVDPHSLLGFFMDTYGSTGDATLNICYVAGVTSGEPKADDDIEELRWFSPEEIPAQIAFQNGRDMIDAWMATK